MESNEANMRTLLPRTFYDRASEVVAQELIGAVLAHGRTAGRIVETEAYLGEHDPAAHARHGRTPRTEVLYGPPGHAYVYQSRHHVCLNVAAGSTGDPGCVLIRAVEPITGQSLMHARRGDVPVKRLADGPGKLCQALAIDMSHYGVDLCNRPGPYIAAAERLPQKIGVSGRIGITRAQDWPLRFFDAQSPYASRPVRDPVKLIDDAPRPKPKGAS